MIRFSATTKISMGLVSMLTTMLLLVSLSGIFPDVQREVAHSRAQLCDAIAVNFALLAQRADMETMRLTMETIAQRNPDILTMAVRRDDGKAMIEVGNHLARWNSASPQKVRDTQVKVPIFAQGQSWGKSSLLFVPYRGGGTG